MDTINRIALFVAVRQPFLDWAQSTDPSVGIDSEMFKPKAYLLEGRDLDDPEELIQENYEAIFEEELASWWLNKALWPNRRSYAMFREWFNIVIADLVFDVSEEAIEYQ